MRTILLEHARRYPLWSPDDLYKLIHQAAMGSEHAVGDGSQVRGWLAREIAGLGEGAEEPLLDPISPDGQVLRVHLRPFVNLQLDPELLTQAFILTANEFRGSAEHLIEYAEDARLMAAEGLLPFSPDEINRLAASMQQAGFPAVHHSAAFEKAYRPAYRVAARDLLPQKILSAE